MAEPKFDKDGNLTNLDELTVQEVATAYSEKNKSVFGRLTAEETARKQAEADRDKAKQDLEEEKKRNEKKPPVEEPKPAPAGPDAEELKLIARGLSDEEIAEAKAIAAGKKITLAEALKDKTFLLFQANFQEEQKKEKAKLGASHGSGQTLTEKPIKPGMSKEEHKAAFDEARGKLS